LFEGARTKLPSKEQFWAPRARVAKDEPIETNANINEQGVRGTDLQISAIAQAFCTGVERGSGQHRIADQNLEEAGRLAASSVTPERVVDVALEMTRQALEGGKSPPLTLKQVSEWAGLG
jgi:hypothetical protein